MQPWVNSENPRRLVAGKLKIDIEIKAASNPSNRSHYALRSGFGRIQSHEIGNTGKRARKAHPKFDFENAG